MSTMKLSKLMSLLMFLIFILSALFSVNQYMDSVTYFLEMDLLGELNTSTFFFVIILDWMSMLFISVVSLISSVVFMYSGSYMQEDKFINKFIMIVLMFVVSMYLMILSPNMLSILLGWDGLGLVSYCLVIYYQNMKSYSAGMLTILSNRVGDLAILLSICWMMNFGSMNIMLISNLFMNNDILIISFFIFLAATTKSAQIPFSAWLPAAMAAPTPVSSLVHSSTLVTAGVYLLIRFNLMTNLSYYLFFISCLTMVMSGLGAFFEMDLKKVIALSTLSQLGVMMMILSMGMKDLAFFHLASHALFKSLLFLCAGFYIHSSVDWQDIRSISHLSISYPVFSMYFCGASLALSGFPFLAGFYSKDLIIENFFMKTNNLFMFILLLLATAMTLIYSIRLIYITFFMKMGVSNFSTNKEDWTMIYPMTLLFLLSMVGGSTMSWLYFPSSIVFIPLYTKLLVLVLLFACYLLMLKYNGFLFISMKILSFLSLMWFMPYLSTLYLIFSMKKSFYMMKLMDQGWMEYLGGQGLSTVIKKNSSFIDFSHLINIKQMMYVMFIFFILMIFML